VGPGPSDATGTPRPSTVLLARVLEITSGADLQRELNLAGAAGQAAGALPVEMPTYLVRVERETGTTQRTARLVALNGRALAKPPSRAPGGPSPTDATVGTGPKDRAGRDTVSPDPERDDDKVLRAAARAALERYLDRAPRRIRGVHRTVTIGGRTAVMGVVNVTPDSFSDGGRYLDPDRAVEHALRLAEEGADLLDIGGESTRPGAGATAVETELKRVLPVLSRLHARSPVPLSIDTRKAEVARAALEAGADWVNDVSGLRDPDMRRVVVAAEAPTVVMHMRGTPESMQADLGYRDLRGEVFRDLAEASRRVIAEGLPADRVLIDPGLGFGKSAEQNLELLLHLGEFRSLGFPVVIGPSRKSFLGKALGGAPADARLEAGLAAAVLASRAGAAIVRTHDVGPTVRALALADAVARGRFPDAPAAPDRASARPGSA
jgi:dihydropteroate synthase